MNTADLHEEKSSSTHISSRQRILILGVSWLLFLVLIASILWTIQERWGNQLPWGNLNVASPGMFHQSIASSLKTTGKSQQTTRAIQETDMKVLNGTLTRQYLKKWMEQRKVEVRGIEAPPITVPLVYRGNSYLKEVALTFDDGPLPNSTPKILSILKKYGVHATFFCIGQQVDEWPSLVKQELDQGNAVGNHSWDHSDLTKLTDNQLNYQFNSTSNSIQKALGIRPTMFRPPYGAYNANVLAHARSANVTTFLWSVDTQDWSRPGTSAIVNAVKDQVDNGGIILMHDGGGDRTQTAEALPIVITWLEEHHYKIVSLKQLLSDFNYKPAPAKKNDAKPIPAEKSQIKPDKKG